MKRRLFTLAALMVLAVASLSAQSFVGKWKATEEFEKQMDFEKGMDLYLETTATDIKVLMIASVQEDGMDMKMQFVMPGTYTRSGDQVKARFNKSKIDFEILDLKTTDPEISAFLKDPEMKKLLYGLIKEQAMQDSDAKEAIGPLAEAFETFTISSLTQSTMTVMLQDALELKLTRVK